MPHVCSQLTLGGEQKAESSSGTDGLLEAFIGGKAASKP